MNWFRKHAAQEWYGNLRDDLEFWQEPDPAPVYKQYNVTDQRQVDLNGTKVWVFTHNGEKWVWEDGYSPKRATDWIYDQHDPGRYVTLRDFNQDFWGDMGDGFILYHASPEENFESIRRHGIRASDETRGINNRGTGAAVFCSSNVNDIQSYGIPIGIDFSAMKRDGYMPTVSPEGPVEEKEAYEVLARKIGLDDFFHEIEQGISEETVVVYGNIPAKYLRFQ